MPARVSRERLGSDAMTLLRSTNPGIVIPTRFSSSLAARTPLIAINAMCMAGGYGPTLRPDCGEEALRGVHDRWLCQVKLAAHPRESVSELLELKWTDGRSARDWRQPSTRREKAADDGGLWSSVRQDGPRLRTILSDQGRQPEGDVDARVANHREVPIHQDRRPIGTEADVVAADIQVQEVGTVDPAGIRG